MIKAQKPEEISFAFTAVGQDQLFILCRQIVRTGLSTRRFPASKAPSAVIKQQIIISINNTTQFILSQGVFLFISRPETSVPSKIALRNQ